MGHFSKNHFFRTSVSKEIFFRKETFPKTIFPVFLSKGGFAKRNFLKNIKTKFSENEILQKDFLKK